MPIVPCDDRKAVSFGDTCDERIAEIQITSGFAGTCPEFSRPLHPQPFQWQYADAVFVNPHDRRKHLSQSLPTATLRE